MPNSVEWLLKTNSIIFLLIFVIGIGLTATTYKGRKTLYDYCFWKYLLYVIVGFLFTKATVFRILGNPVSGNEQLVLIMVAGFAMLYSLVGKMVNSSVFEKTIHKLFDFIDSKKSKNGLSKN